MRRPTAGTVMAMVVGTGCLVGGLVGLAPLPAPAAPPAPPPPPVACTYTVAEGQSLTIIATELAASGVSVESLQAENAIANPDVINSGQVLDVCIGNGVDDRTGAATGAAPAAAPDSSPVGLQQARLNELLGQFGFQPLTVDGISGPKTRQALCAARLLLGFPVTRADMTPGSDEERWMLAVPTALAPPPTAALEAAKWVLIDQTCQVMFAGEGGRLVFVFPTSTGVPEFPTRTLDRADAFRYDPASGNGGWHNSTTFPAAADNPLNGNMYKPIYFHRGQAIHGANNVPPQPASHGCARLRLADQDALVAWAGLAEATSATWETEDVDLIVTTQGDYSAG